VTVASASNSFTTTALKYNDVISCVLKSNALCALPDSAVSNSIQVNFFPDTVKVSPVNATICINGNIQLTAEGGFAYQWHYNGAVIPGATSPVYNATAPGSYLVKVTNVNCVIPDSAIVVLDKPVAVISPSSALVCPGKVQLLSATPGNAFQWFLNGIALAGETSITYTATVPGKYAVRVSDSLCANLSEEAILTPGSGPKPVRYEMARVARNKAYGLTARNIGVNYRWQPITGLNNPLIKNPVVTISQDRKYFIQISVPGQCDVTDTLDVIVFDKPGVYVPTAFTPDGNGTNDLLRPIPVHIRKLVYFRVWNRWGGLVYNTTLMNAGWNGKVNGKPVDPGVYVWSCEAVDEDGKTIVLKGTTVLIR
jgi:gliding motility-associated-like protein